MMQLELLEYVPPQRVAAVERYPGVLVRVSGHDREARLDAICEVMNALDRAGFNALASYSGRFPWPYEVGGRVEFRFPTRSTSEAQRAVAFVAAREAAR